MKLTKEQLVKIIKEELESINEGGYPFQDAEGRSIYEKLEELQELLPAGTDPKARTLLYNIMDEFLKLQTEHIKRGATGA